MLNFIFVIWGLIFVYFYFLINSEQSGEDKNKNAKPIESVKNPVSGTNNQDSNTNPVDNKKSDDIEHGINPDPVKSEPNPKNLRPDGETGYDPKNSDDEDDTIPYQTPNEDQLPPNSDPVINKPYYYLIKDAMSHYYPSLTINKKNPDIKEKQEHYYWFRENPTKIKPILVNDITKKNMVYEVYNDNKLVLFLRDSYKYDYDVKYHSLELPELTKIINVISVTDKEQLQNKNGHVKITAPKAKDNPMRNIVLKIDYSDGNKIYTKEFNMKPTIVEFLK